MRLIDADELWTDTTRNIDCCEDFLEVIERQPTIDPVQHGLWIKTGQSFLFSYRFRNYSCSVCGYDIDKTKYRYCPNCGSRNEVDENDCY